MKGLNDFARIVLFVFGSFLGKGTQNLKKKRFFQYLNNFKPKTTVARQAYFPHL